MQPNPAEPSASQSGLIVDDGQAFYFPKHVLENHVQSGGQSSNEGIGHPPERSPLTRPQELVQEEDGSSRPQNPGGFRQASAGVGNHGENEVEHDGVETGIRKGQALDVAENGVKTESSNARSSPRQHRGSDVAAHVTVYRREQG